MHQSLLDQLPVVPARIDHTHAHELAVIGVVLACNLRVLARHLLAART